MMLTFIKVRQLSEVHFHETWLDLGKLANNWLFKWKLEAVLTVVVLRRNCM